MKNNNKPSIIYFGYSSWSEMWKRVQHYMYLPMQVGFVNHIIFANSDLGTKEMKNHL